jgi:hypothetical protein
MASTDQLLYLESDDEITSVVRRLREADALRVVLVASGRSKPTNSVVALRLLAQVAAEEGREVALVADAAARSLAGEAGIPAFASVADASAEDAVALDPAPPRRAPIHVVRGDPVAPVAATSLPDAVPPSPERDRSAETQAVPLPPVPHPAPRPRPALRGLRLRRLPRAALGALVALLLLAGALLAAVAPAATIVIEPATTDIGPVSYAVPVERAGSDIGEVQATLPGAATGVHTDPSPASGVVKFLNWNTVDVEVPAGTLVAAGEVQFRTLATIVVDNGLLGFPIDPGEETVAAEAVTPGPAGNVAAEAIDFIVDDVVRGRLRGFPNNPRELVINEQPTTGGSLNEEPEVTQEDVDRVLAALRTELEQALADRLEDDPSRVYGPVAAGELQVEIPDDLVGRIGEAQFELTASMTYDRPYASGDTVREAVREELLADASVRPEGSEILPESVSIDVGQAVLDGSDLRVSAVVRARAARSVDRAAVIETVKGLTADEVLAALDGFGDVSLKLWPDWVKQVPGLDWRIDVQVRDPSRGVSPSPAESGG